MVYIKINGRYKTLKEIAIEYDVPLDLIKGRWSNGVRDIEKLIAPKWDKWRKEE